MFFKKSKHQAFAEVVVFSPREIIKGDPFVEKIWGKSERLFFELELSFLLFCLSSTRLKNEDMMLVEKKLVLVLIKTVSEEVCFGGETFQSVIRNRFGQYTNACRNNHEGSEAKALEAVFFGFYAIDKKENALRSVKDDLSGKLSIASPTDRMVFAKALVKLQATIDKSIENFF